MSKLYRAKEFLLNSASRPAAAYLISATGAEDANIFASFFCQAVFCEVKQACGKCVNCRRYEDGNIVDLFEIDVEGQIRIGDVRGISEFLASAAYQHTVRCVLVKNAQEMTVQSQNYLLKLIEFPPQNTVFIFATNQKERILPTVRSRCIDVEVPLLSTEELAIQLEGKLPQERIGYAAAWGAGSLAEAKKLGTDDSLVEVRDAAERILLRLATKANPSLFLMEQEIQACDKQILNLLYAMITMARDAIYIKNGVEKLMNPDKRSSLVEISDGFTILQLNGIISVTNKQYETIHRFPQLRRDLMIRNLLFDILEVKHGKSSRGAV